MYQVELDAVKGCKQQYNENLSSPADEQEMKRFSEVYYQSYHLEVPRSYLELLGQCNGMEFNGCIIYGTDNFWENQLDYDFLADDYIIFAEYDVGWFCMEKSGGKLCELDKPSAREVQTFDTMEDMIKYVLDLAVRL